MSNIDFYKIKDAVERRDKYLSEHPQLSDLQSRINEVLKKCGNDSYKRCAALQELMLNKWHEIIKAWENES